MGTAGHGFVGGCKSYLDGCVRYKGHQARQGTRVHAGLHLTRPTKARCIVDSVQRFNKHLQREPAASTRPAESARELSTRSSSAAGLAAPLTATGWSRACSRPASRGIKPTSGATCVQGQENHDILMPHCRAAVPWFPHLHAVPVACCHEQCLANERLRGRWAPARHTLEDRYQWRYLGRGVPRMSAFAPASRLESQSRTCTAVPLPPAAVGCPSPTLLPPELQPEQLQRRGRRGPRTATDIDTKHTGWRRY